MDQPDAECVPTMDDEDDAPPSGLGLGPDGGSGLSLDPAAPCLLNSGLRSTLSSSSLRPRPARAQFTSDIVFLLSVGGADFELEEFSKVFQTKVKLILV